MVATLLFTAQITVVIREAVRTPVKEIAKAKPSPPFLKSHYVTWGAIFLGSLAATVFGGPELGVRAALPLGLAATVGGYLLGKCAAGLLLCSRTLVLRRCSRGSKWQGAGNEVLPDICSSSRAYCLLIL